MDRCRREIAAIEAEILAGNPDLPVYALRYRTGMRNSASCKTRYDGMRIRSRIERLEDEMLPLPAGPPMQAKHHGCQFRGEGGYRTSVRGARICSFRPPLANDSMAASEVG